MYIHSAAGAAAGTAAVFVVITDFLFLLRRHRVQVDNRVPGPDRLQLRYCKLLHDEGVCIPIYLPTAV